MVAANTVEHDSRLRRSAAALAGDGHEVAIVGFAGPGLPAEEQLRLSLGTHVEIKRRGKRGVVEIAFANEDELQRLYEYLTARR